MYVGNCTKAEGAILSCAISFSADAYPGQYTLSLYRNETSYLILFQDYYLSNPNYNKNDWQSGIVCDDYSVKMGQELICYADLSDSLSSAEKIEFTNDMKIAVDDTGYLNPDGSLYNSIYEEAAGNCELYGNDDLKCTFLFGKNRKPGQYSVYIGLPHSDYGYGFVEVELLGSTANNANKVAPILTSVRTGCWG